MIVKKAEYIKDYKVKLFFSDGVAKIVDFKPFLKSTRTLINPLLDTNYFKSFYIDEITICWPNGLDFAPDLLHKIGVDVKIEAKQITARVRSQRKKSNKVYALVKKRPKKINK